MQIVIRVVTFQCGEWFCMSLFSLSCLYRAPRFTEYWLSRVHLGRTSNYVIVISVSLNVLLCCLRQRVAITVVLLFWARYDYYAVTLHLFIYLFRTDFLRSEWANYLQFPFQTWKQKLWIQSEQGIIPCVSVILGRPVSRGCWLCSCQAVRLKNATHFGLHRKKTSSVHLGLLFLFHLLRFTLERNANWILVRVSWALVLLFRFVCV